MRRLTRDMSVAIVGALAAIAASARAQAPEGSDRMSLMAVADSVRVLKVLDYTVRDSAKNAAVWYRRGMVAWALYERSLHQPPARGLYWQQLTSLADTSLRRALELEPNNEKYFTAVAHFLLQSGVTFRTYGAYGVFNDELERVRKSGSADDIARTAFEAARLHWLRYDRFVCRAVLYAEGLPAPMLEAPGQAGGARPPPQTSVAVDYSGEVDYLKAELLLREGYAAAPADMRLFRQYAVLLADHKRWRELANLARDHINRVPRDGWGYMTMGLAQHRIGNARVSAAAFDSGFAALGDSVRTLLDRFERTLDPQSLAAYNDNAPDAKRKVEAVYWRNQDPIWSVDGTEPRAEFLARTTFAQLRWGADELKLDGVTSDFGNLYLRTGKWMMGWDNTGYFWRPDGLNDARMDICVPQVKPWYFAGETRVPGGPRASWGNLARMRIDSIPTQAARFRATLDSTDIVVAVLPPVTLLERVAQVKGPARTDFWLLANGTDEFAHDSVRPATAGVHTFVRRVPPGMYVYRTESSAEASLVAARATAGLTAGDDPRTGFSSRGFGMSDLLLASRITSGVSPQRWTDFATTPLVGAALKKSQVSILWENYELGASQGGVAYTITITIRREDTLQTAAGRITAGIIGGIASAIGVNRAKDQVEFTLERSGPAAAIIPDFVSLSLGDTPSGAYLLTLKVADRATGLTTGRSQRLRIVDSAAGAQPRR